MESRENFPLVTYTGGRCVYTHSRGTHPRLTYIAGQARPIARLCASLLLLSRFQHTHTLGSIVIINSILGYTNAHHSAGHPAAAARNACQLWFLLLFQRFFSRRHGVFLNRPITVNSISSSF